MENLNKNNERVFNSEKRFEQSQQPQEKKRFKLGEMSKGKKWGLGTAAALLLVGGGYWIYNKVWGKKGSAEEIVEEEKTNKEQPKEEKK